MNETMKTLMERRSCRSYKSDPVPEEILDQILEAGTFAATGMGKQSPIMIAVTDKKVRDRLSGMNADVMGGHRIRPEKAVCVSSVIYLWKRKRFRISARGSEKIWYDGFS